MINHARTLLLNIPARRTQMQDPGYEYIPDAFQPVRLNTALHLLRRALFGANPDNYFLNIRARELLGYIHETELAQYVYALDPRITYWPPAGTNFFENAKTRVNIVQTGGQLLRLNFGGTFAANNATGTSTQTYDVALNNVGGTLFVNTQQTTKRIDPVITEIKSTAATPAIPLNETNLQFAVNFTSAAAPPPPTAVLLTELAEFIVEEQYASDGNPSGLEIEPQEFLTLAMSSRPPRLASTAAGAEIARWQITVRTNPAPVISNLSQLELLGAPLFLELFGIKDEEPYRTFKNLWADHPLPQYKLSGLVLAAIYRTNELSRTNNG
jgi:hypothetical protein